jgi:Tsi6
MNRIDLFKNALRDSRRLKEEFPWSIPLQSVIDQIEYLINVESGKSTDTSRLRTINIGIIAARDIEDMDMVVAEEIYAVCDEVKKMCTGKE